MTFVQTFKVPRRKHEIPFFFLFLRSIQNFSYCGIPSFGMAADREKRLFVVRGSSLLNDPRPLLCMYKPVSIARMYLREHYFVAAWAITTSLPPTITDYFALSLSLSLSLHHPLYVYVYFLHCVTGLAHRSRAAAQ